MQRAKISAYLILLLFSFISCQEPTEVLVPKGDDGQVFALDVGGSEIPYLVITTDGEIPYEPGVAARMKIYQQQKLIQEQRIDIEYRGKTSFRLSDKKSFNFETIDGSGEDMDVSFFGLPEEEDWRLIGHVVNLQEKYAWDRSLIYNHVAYRLSLEIGKYASRGVFVELELNGEYLGVYYFCEKLKRDSERIDIKSMNASSENFTGGYILKIDKSDAGPEHDNKPLSYFMSNWDDDARYTAFNSFRSDFDISGQPLNFSPFGAPYHPMLYLETYFNYEYPDAEDLTTDQKTYIQEYVNQFEKSFFQENMPGEDPAYLEYMDLDSFLDYFIINELCRNVDAYRISTFLTKDRDGKLAMGPVWDFNIGFDEADRIPANDWVVNYNNYVSEDPWMVPFWWSKLLQDETFRNALKERWAFFRKGPLSESNIQGIIDFSVNKLVQNGAVKRNYDKWDQGIGINYDQSISDLKSFLIDRLRWMDSEIGSL
ncbi:MAG: CotH kinase family protein [Algoriphagus sp.]|uniref:CotH kinase family protein n=1 Tax=Algoriphagus sp. TaxID=1872435 RepID=UPI001859EE36|nr:CotH kinase family protein [Algoriphagus sp.]NVJ84683.1 CotH kinase family protein [Algoriphagus sp.]